MSWPLLVVLVATDATGALVQSKAGLAAVAAYEANTPGRAARLAKKALANDDLDPLERDALLFVRGLGLERSGNRTLGAQAFASIANSQVLDGLDGHLSYFRARNARRENPQDEAVLALLERTPLEGRYGPEARTLWVRTLLAQGEIDAAHELALETADEMRFGRREPESLMLLAQCKERLAVVHIRAKQWRESRALRREAAGLYRRVEVLWPHYPIAGRAREERERLGGHGIEPAPADLERLLERARRYHARALPRNAFELIQQIRILLPVGPRHRARYELDLLEGELSFRLRRFRRSYKLLREVKRRAPDDELRARAGLTLGALFARRAYDPAIAEYLSVGNGFPDTASAPKGFLNAAELARRKGDEASATAAFEHCVVRYPDAPEAARARWALAWMDYGRGDLDAAAARLDTLLAEVDEAALPKTSERRFYERARYWRARIRGARGDKADAIADYLRLLEAHPLDYYGLMAARRLAAAGALPAPTTRAVAAEPGARHPEIAAAEIYVRIGLYSEARSTLYAMRRDALSGLDRRAGARLWLEMGDYRRSHRMAPVPWAGGVPHFDPNDPIDAKLAYPRAFSEVVEGPLRDPGVDPWLFYALMRAESAFDPDARSPAGALGLTQVIRKTAYRTARRLRLRPFSYSMLYQPEKSVQVGSAYLARLLEAFGGHPALALAAYNAGEEAVARWVRARGHLPMDAFLEEVPYAETNRYVRKVLSFYGVYRALYEGSAAPQLVMDDTIAPATLARARAAKDDLSALWQPLHTPKAGRAKTDTTLTLTPGQAPPEGGDDGGEGRGKPVITQ